MSTNQAFDPLTTEELTDNVEDGMTSKVNVNMMADPPRTKNKPIVPVFNTVGPNEVDAPASPSASTGDIEAEPDIMSALLQSLTAPPQALGSGSVNISFTAPNVPPPVPASNFNVNCDYYKALGLKSDQNIYPDSIRRAFNGKALLYSPYSEKGKAKRAKGGPAALNADSAWLRVQEAYDILSTPILRQAYDDARRNFAGPTANVPGRYRPY